MMKFNKTLAITAILLATATTVPAFAETYNDVAPSYYYTQGQNFYTTGQYTSAITSFRKALRENPNDNSSKVGLINSYISRAEFYNNTQKNPQKALADLKSAAFYFVCFNGKSSSANAAYTSAMANLNTLEHALNADITAPGFMKTAKALRLKGEFAAAGYDYYRAMEAPANAKAANVGLGDVLKILGQPKAATMYFEKAVKAAPNDAEVRLKAARAYEDCGEYTLASENYNVALENLESSNEKEEILNSLEKICRQRVEKNPADGEAHCNLGVIYQKRGNTEGALAEYQTAEKLNPSLLITKINAAILYYDKKKYKESIDFCNKALLGDPKNVQARLQKAKCFQAMSLWENSAEEYKNVLKYDENNAEAQFGLAEIYSRNMPAEDALSTLKAQGITLSPEFYAQTAYAAHKNKDIEKAIKYYKLAIDANQNDKSLYLNLAQIYSGRNEMKQAIAYAELAKQKFPTDKQVLDFNKELQQRYTGSLFEEAADLREKGEYKAALEKYNKISPQGYDSFVGTAAVYQLMKDYPKAVEFYKKALEIKPADETVLLTISGIYIEQDDFDKAQEYINKIKNSTNPKVKEFKDYITQQIQSRDLNLAIQKYESKDYASAQAILTNLINKKSVDYMPYYYRAMVFDALGKYKEAIADYETVIAKDSSIALVYYSLGVDYDALKNFPRAIQNYKKFLELTKENNAYTEYARTRIKQ